MKKIDLEYSLRQKFVDDLSIPIKLLTSPYFEYYLNLYWDDLEIEKKLQWYLSDLEKFNGKDGLKAEWYKVKDQIEKDIKSQPKYLELQNKVFDTALQNPMDKGNPYNLNFLDKTCVSIDIRSANYNALKIFDESLVLNSKDYDDLLSKYTSSLTLKGSKIFRQLIFEPILAKKQSQIQRRVIDEISIPLMATLKPVTSRAVSNDELVLAFDRCDLLEIKQIVENEVQKLSYKDILKVESFDVHHLEGTFFYKKTHDKKLILRNVPAQIYPQCLKKARNEEITEMDLIFLDPLTQKVAKYTKSIFEKE